MKDKVTQCLWATMCV